MAYGNDTAPAGVPPLQGELNSHGSLLAELTKEFDALEERLRNVLRPTLEPALKQPAVDNSQTSGLSPQATAIPSPHVSQVRQHQTMVQQLLGRLRDWRDRLEA